MPSKSQRCLENCGRTSLPVHHDGEDDDGVHGDGDDDGGNDGEDDAD